MQRGKTRVGSRGSFQHSADETKSGENARHRSNLEYMRSIRRLSDGASGEFRSLMRKNSKHLPLWNRAQRENRSSQTYVSCLIDDLSWAFEVLMMSSNFSVNSMSSNSINSNNSMSSNNKEQGGQEPALPAPGLGGIQSPSNSLSISRIDFKDVEEMAVFIHQTQSSSIRGYHDLNLVFQVTGGASPVQLLAAFFRDTVYHYQDGDETTMHPKQKEMLEGIFDPKSFKLSSGFLESDEIYEMIIDIFGVRKTESLDIQFKLELRAMDILLSAIMAVKFLRRHLPKRDLAQIVVCMERTIPFRSQDEFGRSASDRLYGRLIEVNQNFRLGMTEMELELTCQMATDLSNRMMGVYATPDPDKFIAQAWGLLSELNAPLRQNKLYSLNEFYYAIWDMYRFLENVDPSIYDTFRGIPKESEIIDFQKALVKNQSVCATYLKLKIVEVATITALAILSGGADVPKSMFYGDLIPGMSALGDALPQLDPRDVARNGCYVEVYDMMYKPRTTGVSFDQDNAPIAAYIYGMIGEIKVSSIFEKCIYPMTITSSWELIELLPYKVIEVISNELMLIAPSRADLLDEILQDFRIDTHLSRAGSWKIAPTSRGSSFRGL